MRGLKRYTANAQVKQRGKKIMRIFMRRCRAKRGAAKPAAIYKYVTIPKQKCD
jgi:hypothetical protein